MSKAGPTIDGTWGGHDKFGQAWVGLPVGCRRSDQDKPASFSFKMPAVCILTAATVRSYSSLQYELEHRKLLELESKSVCL
ncbi:MAG: hypothetical protein CMM07_16900 [Rhodopirellula sp.]|nr:hypothetical protein [Rhodopirellula sp.]